MLEGESREIYRFGEFELDVTAYELRRAGIGIRLERQPMDLLILLVQRRGELVSRTDIIDRLWGKDVFVDVETGVHTAARKIRQALGDSPGAPVYLETVPAKGYRFIAPVERVAPNDPFVPVNVSEPDVRERPSGGDPQRPAIRSGWRLATGLVAGVLAAAGGAWVWGGPDSRKAHVTLAVLPFENLTGDAERGYVADGLMEETIASLGQIDPERVRVIGRTSSAIYRNTNKSAAEIGADLGADYLVEGSVRAEQLRLRITAKLIRVQGQAQVWVASYDREPASVLALQRELSAAIAEQIRHRLSPDRLDALRRRHTGSADAYDHYLRGLTFANQRTPATMRLAIQHFERATAVDPEYALAWAALALAHAQSPLNSDTNPADVSGPARQAARQAVRAAPELAEAQFATGYINWTLDWNWPAAESALRKVVDLDPGSAMPHLVLGHLLSQTGRHNEAGPLMRRARELDPLSALAHALSSQVAFQARDYSAAVDHARQAVVVSPELWIGHVMLGQAQQARGETAPSLESFLHAARFSADNSKALAMKGHLLATTGRRSEALEVLKTLEAASRARYVPPYAMALVHAGLGDSDAVFEWLDRAYAARDVHLMFLTVDFKWDRYRTDPRFAAVLARCNFMRGQRRAD